MIRFLHCGLLFALFLLAGCGAIPLNYAYVPPKPEPPPAPAPAAMATSITEPAPPQAPSASATASAISNTAATQATEQAVSELKHTQQAQATANLSANTSLNTNSVQQNTAIHSMPAVTPQPPVQIGPTMATPAPELNAQALFENGRYLEAIDKIKNSEKNNNKLLAQSYQKLIKQYEQAGNKEAALKALENYLSDIPSAKKEKKPDSKQHKHSLSAKQKNSIKELNFKAAIFYQAREFDHAKGRWNQVLKIDPKNADALAGLEKIRKWEEFLSKIP